MGWSEGSLIVCSIVDIVKDDLSVGKKIELYDWLVQYCMDNDCDTLYECMNLDPILNEVLLEYDPDLAEHYNLDVDEDSE